MARYGYRIGAESADMEAMSDARAEEAVRALALSWLNPGESLRWELYGDGPDGVGRGELLASGMVERGC